MVASAEIQRRAAPAKMNPLHTRVATRKPANDKEILQVLDITLIHAVVGIGMTQLYMRFLNIPHSVSFWVKKFVNQTDI